MKKDFIPVGWLSVLPKGTQDQYDTYLGEQICNHVLSCPVRVKEILLGTLREYYATNGLTLKIPKKGSE